MAIKQVLVLVAACALAAQAKVVFEETWDIHPILKYSKLEFEFFGEPGSFNVDVEKCPGGRDNISPDYKHCLFLDLKRCENIHFPDKGGCFRNEIGLRDELNVFDYERTYFVGMSFYVPEDFQYDTLKTIHCQIKANGGAFFSPGGPSFSLITQYGMWGIGIRGSSDCLETCKIETGIMEYFAPVEPGTWVDFVWETRLSFIKNGPGYGKMWMNGNVVFEKYNLLTTYKDPFDQGVFIKWGVYKHQWGEGDQGGFLGDYMSMFIGAVRIARGRKGWDQADTRPRCYDLETCCNTCLDGEKNPLYNFEHCADECKDAKDDAPAVCSMQASEPCDDLNSCCDKCSAGGGHSAKYDAGQCFSHCRVEENSGNANKNRFKKRCFQTGYNGCATNHLDCNNFDSVCEQSQFSFGCRCAKGFTISNKNGRECQEQKEARIKNPDTFPGVVREE